MSTVDASRKFPRPYYDAMCEYYGKPHMSHDRFVESKRFQEKFLTIIRPPYPMYYLTRDGFKIDKIRVHKFCAESLNEILYDIGNLKPEFIRQYDLDLFGGCYNFRKIRGGETLSIHSWGAAIDLAPQKNRLGLPAGSHPNMMPAVAVEIFARHGWKWLGKSTRPDGMHFQATA